MSEQGKEAAERSAHVTRGIVIENCTIQKPHPIREYKTAEGRTVGELRIVHELREQVKRLREALEPFAILSEYYAWAHPTEMIEPQMPALSLKRAAEAFKEPPL